MRTVEVMEDDPAMRALLLEWLADEGYRMRVHGLSYVPTAWEADAVVVDLSNQQLQGAEAIRHARSRFASAAVVGLSTRLIHAPAGDSLQAHTLGPGVWAAEARCFKNRHFGGSLRHCLGRKNRASAILEPRNLRPRFRFLLPPRRLAELFPKPCSRQALVAAMARAIAGAR